MENQVKATQQQNIEQVRLYIELDIVMFTIDVGTRNYRRSRW